MTTTHTERQPLPSFINMRALRRKLGHAAPSTIRSMVADGLLPRQSNQGTTSASSMRPPFMRLSPRWPRAAA